MTQYRVSFYIPLFVDMEVEAEDAVFATEHAINEFWENIVEYVVIGPEDAQVTKVRE